MALTEWLAIAQDDIVGRFLSLPHQRLQSGEEKKKSPEKKARGCPTGGWGNSRGLGGQEAILPYQVSRSRTCPILWVCKRCAIPDRRIACGSCVDLESVHFRHNITRGGLVKSGEESDKNIGGRYEMLSVLGGIGIRVLLGL